MNQKLVQVLTMAWAMGTLEIPWLAASPAVN